VCAIGNVCLLAYSHEFKFGVVLSMPTSFFALIVLQTITDVSERDEATKVVDDGPKRRFNDARVATAVNFE
jgi:hypothetical protein